MNKEICEKILKSRAPQGVIQGYQILQAQGDARKMGVSTENFLEFLKTVQGYRYGSVFSLHDFFVFMEDDDEYCSFVLPVSQAS